MRLTRYLALASCLSYLVACSGRTVRLDHETVGAAGAAAEDDGSKPTLLFEQHGAPLTAYELQVDDTRVYWQTQDGALQSCRKANCQQSVTRYASSSEMSLGGENVFSNFAVSMGYVAWLANPPRGTIYACPSAGCDNQPTRLIRDPDVGEGGYLYGLTADDGSVYWLSTQQLYRCALGGCGAAPERLPFGERAMPTFFGADAFWIERTDSATRIWRAPKDGSANATTFVERPNPPGPNGLAAISAIAVSSHYVYWLDDTSRLLRCPLAGCEGGPEVLDAEADDKLHLRADERGVYWLATSAGVPTPTDGLHFCPHTGCTSPTALSGFDTLGTYALDDEFIYFTAHVPPNWGTLGGDIQRSRKPSL